MSSYLNQWLLHLSAGGGRSSERRWWSRWPRRFPSSSLRLRTETEKKNVREWLFTTKQKSHSHRNPLRNGWTHSGVFVDLLVVDDVGGFISLCLEIKRVPLSVNDINLEITCDPAAATQTPTNTKRRRLGVFLLHLCSVNSAVLGWISWIYLNQSQQQFSKVSGRVSCHVFLQLLFKHCTEK